MILLHGMLEAKLPLPNSTRIRSLIIGVAIVFVATLFNLFYLNHNSLAIEASDIKWQGDSIEYQGKTFSGPKTSARDDGTSFAPGTKYWSYENNGTMEAIAPSDEQDPKNSTAYNYQTYKLDPQTGRPTNPSNTQNLTPYENKSDYAKTCNIPTLGWLVCPISNFLAEGMDYLFDVVVKFVEIQPLPTGNNTVLFKVWGIMRGIANSLFVVAGLLLIYSYMTNNAFSVYEVKKLLPKLIVAAALVNLSYYLCSLTIDVFNIIGYNTYDFFENIRVQSLSGSQSSADLNWKDLTAAILSGATAIAGINFAIASAGGVVASFFLVLPSLVGATIAVIVAIITLAARQAIIIALVAIAPIACVAMLLPNTEDLFDKWRQTFINMLAVFPLFSLLFGASQLAGDVIIHTADGFPMVILGLLVRVAPLIVAPVLVKAGDRLVGLVNDKSKGFLDRFQNQVKNYSDSKKDEAKARYISDENRARGFTQKIAQFADKQKRLSTQRTEAYGNIREAQIKKDMANVNDRAFKTSLLNTYANDSLEASKQHLERKEQELRAETLRKVKPTYNEATKKFEVNWSSLDNNWEVEIAKASLQRRLDESATSVAESVKAQTYNDLLAKDMEVPVSFGVAPRTTFLMDAAGVERGTTAGKNRVLSKAIAAQRKEHSENVENMAKLFEHYGLKGEDEMDLILGNRSITASHVDYDANGNKVVSHKTFDVNDLLVRETAAINQMKIAFAPNVDKIIAATKEGGSAHVLAEVVGSSMYPNGIPDKVSVYGGNIPEQIAHGKFDPDLLVKAALDNMSKGSLSIDGLSKEDPKGLEKYASVFKDPSYSFKYKDGNQTITTTVGDYLAALKTKPESRDMMRRTLDNANSVLNSEELAKTLKPAARAQLEELKNGLDNFLNN